MEYQYLILITLRRYNRSLNLDHWKTPTKFLESTVNELFIGSKLCELIAWVEFSPSI